MNYDQAAKFYIHMRKNVMTKLAIPHIIKSLTYGNTVAHYSLVQQNSNGRLFTSLPSSKSDVTISPIGEDIYMQKSVGSIALIRCIR